MDDNDLSKWLRRMTPAVRGATAEVERLKRERDEARADNRKLREAAEALGVMPDGYCFCSKNRSGGRGWHEPECRDLRAALAGDG